MALKDQLTTENLKKRFNSPFDLVNYSIKLAKEMILADRSCRVFTPVNNKAYQVLLEISEGKDKLEETSKHTVQDEEDEE